MADVRCPNCGKVNPDFLDVCQFCQAPLKSESMLHIGDKPTKKNTGELEPVLPDWLKDVRQQARNSAEEDAAQALSKAKKEEPPDLLAGLRYQSENADEEEVPDWLANLGSTTRKEKSVPSTPAAPETDFFAQFEKSETVPTEEPPQDTEKSWMSGQLQESTERDELSDWFAKASEEPVETLPSEPDLSRIDSGWEIRTGEIPLPEQPAPKEEEDLSWLHNLEEEAKKTGELSKPKQEPDWFAEFSTPAPTSGQEDLSWLNNLGALPPTEQPAQASSESKEDLSWLNDFGSIPTEERPAQPSSNQEDLSWLDNLGALPPTNESIQQPSKQKEDLSWLSNLDEFPTPEQPRQPSSEPKEDLSWLNNLGETPVSDQPAPPPSQPQEDLSWLHAFEESPPPEGPVSTPTTSADDLSWLNQIGVSQPSQPSSQEDLSWLNSLQGSEESLSATPFTEPPVEQDQAKPFEDEEVAEFPHVSPFTPRQTSPLYPEQEDKSIPDWLKSATEEPSMPLGAEALDQFREDYKIPSGPEEPFSWKNFVPEAKLEDEEQPLTEAPTLSNQEVDSLFSVDMPDWLSHPAAEEQVEKQPTEDIGIHAESGEALAPVDLPSWVQAMRPVEAVISETAAVENQPVEREGPLAGFRGVIPVVPIGSSRRPQPIPLKLQANSEQQASAAIMEQILASETSPRAIPSASKFASQRMLRLIIAALLLVVLSAAIFLRTQFLPVSPILPLDVDAASKTVEFIPDRSSVLVVLDYQPSLAGEMEAVSGPLLNHLESTRHPSLSFISTSTNGPGLVSRLLRNTSANNPDGITYQEGQNYFNLGYLPGGESGVLAFIQSPQTALPTLSGNVPGAFSGYSAVLLLTDHAESARSWIEQLQTAKLSDPSIANQPLLVVSSAQAGPMLQPYSASRQISGMVNGLSDAARFEASKSHPGMARSYWDAFGSGVILAVALIVFGSLWSLISGMRAQRAEAGEA